MMFRSPERRQQREGGLGAQPATALPLPRPLGRQQRRPPLLAGLAGLQLPRPGQAAQQREWAETGSVGSGGSGGLPPGLGGQPGSYPHPGQQLTLNGGSSQNLPELQQKVSF